MPFMKDILNWNCFWIAEPLLLTLLLFTSAAIIKQKVICYAFIVAASFLLTFSATEIYFRLPSGSSSTGLNAARHYESLSSVYITSGQTTQRYEADSHFAPDPDLGYGSNPNGNMRVASRVVRNKEVVYDVLYSTDEEGRRVTPKRGDKADTAIFLFGCSITFGEGLNDKETFAWQLGEMLGEKFQVFNYGFHGYGSHQMLALIESGRLDALARRYKHIYAFYLTINGHEYRSAGLSRWDTHGPRYILKNGALKYVGKFSETPLPAMLQKVFVHSQVFAQVKSAYLRRLALDDALDTHVAIIAKSMHELNTRYHAHALTIILPGYTRIEPMLRDIEVPTLLLAGVMPDYESEHGKYTIKGDGHPNALANMRVAEALSEYILQHKQIANRP